MSMRRAFSPLLASVLLCVLGCGGPPSNPDATVVCTPETDTAFCSRLHKNCDNVTAADNCGSSRTVNCGTCAWPRTCGGGGAPNVCWCYGPDGGACYAQDGGGAGEPDASASKPDAGCNATDGGCPEPDAGASPGLDAATEPPDASAGPTDGAVVVVDGAVIELSTLDPNASGDYPISLAVRGSKIAVAYWVDPDASVPMEGDGGMRATTLHRELRYVEKGGAPESVTMVGNTNSFGGSLVLDSTGKPYIAFLGGPLYHNIDFTESNTVVATHTGAGAPWTQSVAATVPALVVGLWASMAINSSDQLSIGYRNIHYAMAPVPDFAHSNVEFVSGAPGAWSTAGVNCTADNGSCPVWGGMRSEGCGDFVSIALYGASQEPALAWSTSATSVIGPAKDIWFTARSAGLWPTIGTAPLTMKIRTVNSTATGMAGTAYGGPQLAWDSTLGFIVAWDDYMAGQLVAIFGANQSALTSAATEQVYGSGTAWYPALAVSPAGQAALAYYVCSNQPKSSVCMSADDRVELSRRAAANSWQPETVDPAGGHHVRLAFLSDGRAVIAYRDVGHTAIKLAIVPP